MVGNTHVLPDSRLQNETRGSQMVQWAMPDGSCVRTEAVMVYCASCGHPYGWVPEETMACCFYLCRQCYEQYGAIASTYAMPDDEWNKNVLEELRKKASQWGIGHDPTLDDINWLAENNRLGPALEALARESPYPVKS